MFSITKLTINFRNSGCFSVFNKYCAKFEVVLSVNVLEMKISIYTGKEGEDVVRSVNQLVSELENGGCEIYHVYEKSGLQPDTDMLLSIGGDGTFLSAAAIVGSREIPVMGVNLGRLGFLSENRPEDVARAILESDYTVENRTLLSIDDAGTGIISSEFMTALNEMTVHRSGSSMLSVQVTLNGICLPTYWADGLVVSTSSGSTAYSLSVGGPIVLPEAKVLIVSPIAPHNLNVRPLIVPDDSELVLKMTSRDGDFVFSTDNRSMKLSSGDTLYVKMAQFSLKRVRLNRSEFINALTQKLYWGEDIRNIK